MTTLKVTRFHSDGDPEKGMEPTAFVDPAIVVEGKADEKGTNFFTNVRGNMMSGVWECTPCKEAIESYPCDEVMFILEGSVTVVDPDGDAETFGPGETMSMPQGWKGTWEITKTLRKYYVILM